MMVVDVTAQLTPVLHGMVVLLMVAAAAIVAPNLAEAVRKVLSRVRHQNGRRLQIGAAHPAPVSA